MENTKKEKVAGVAKKPMKSNQRKSSMSKSEPPSSLLFGHKNKKGEVVIPPRFDMVGEFEGPYARAQLNDKWGVIDTKGEWCFEPKFDFIGKIENGAVTIRENKVWGVADLSGHVLLAPQYDEIASIGETVVSVRKGTGFSVIDFDGKLIKDGFRKIYKWNDGYALVVLEGWRRGLLSEAGEWLIGPSGNVVYDFSEGFAAFEKDGKIGYYNLKGAVAIEPIFDAAFSFSEGLARVRQHDLFGYIDSSGKIVIPCTWGDPEQIGNRNFGQDASLFKNGFAIAAQFTGRSGDPEAFFIDRDGKSFDIYDKSISRSVNELQRFSIDNPKWIEYEENLEISPSFIRMIKRYRKKFESTLEKDSAALKEVIHSILSREFRPDTAYLKINLDDGNEYGLTLFSYLSDGEEDIADGLPTLKAVAKMSESDGLEEGENTKELDALEDALDVSSQLIMKRFSELWNTEGGDKYPIPVYIQVEDDFTWMDLKSGEISKAL